MKSQVWADYQVAMTKRATTTEKWWRNPNCIRLDQNKGGMKVAAIIWPSSGKTQPWLSNFDLGCLSECAEGRDVAAAALNSTRDCVKITASYS